MATVSVITPVFNRPDHLAEAAASIQQQSCTDWEHIIIDDGSSNPATRNVLAQLEKQPKTFVYRIENKGLGAARNAGIAKATGKYILTLDDDDKWHTEFMKRALEVFATNDNIGVVTAWMQYFGAGKGLVKPKGGDVKNFLVNNNCAHAMFRKDYWEMAGKYEEDRILQAYTDWDLWLRITAKGYDIKVIPDALFYYRIHKDTSMLKDAQQRHLEIFRFMIEKNRSVYEKYVTDALCQLEDKLIEARKSSGMKAIANRFKDFFIVKKNDR